MICVLAAAPLSASAARLATKGESSSGMTPPDEFEGKKTCDFSKNDPVQTKKQTCCHFWQNLPYPTYNTQCTDPDGNGAEYSTSGCRNLDGITNSDLGFKDNTDCENIKHFERIGGPSGRWYSNKAIPGATLQQEGEKYFIK